MTSDKKIRPQQWWQSFQFKDFRYLWASTFFQSIGFGMDNVALGWIVFEKTDSAFMVGLAAALRMVPLFLLGVFSGLIADNVERRIFLRIFTIVGGGLMALLGVLLIIGYDQIWIIIAIATITGATFAFVLTLRQAYTFDIVGASLSLNGLSMLQIASQTGGVFGALISGILISKLGAGPQFVVIGLMYLISFLVLFGASESGQAASRRRESLNSNFKGYIDLIKEYPVLLILMCLASITEIFGFTHMSLIPVFAKEVLSVGPIGLGILTAIRQVGGFLGLFALALLGDYNKKGQLMFYIVVFFGVGQIFLSFADNLYLFAIFLLFVNACAMSVDTLYKTLMQQNVPNEQRGRAMGSWVLSIGTAPIGHLGIGGIATAFGAPMAVLFNGVMLTAAGISTFICLPKIRKLP
ncbi:MAG: MFS transporter [SAR202 cluster bacterium]|nr:MFS transporter [SAR202 cluster bacterium]